MIQAVGLFSGGLDSVLASQLLQRQGIVVHAVYFRQPWTEKDPGQVRQIAESLSLPFHVIDLGRDYLEMLLSPRYGYGKAFNPCTDCHHFMVRKAAALMRRIGGKFVFTGEVLGQRPMSQRRQCLELVERDSGLEGYLLRPLSAHLLEETIPERQGWVNRAALLGLSGRSRSPQLALARQWGIDGFFPTGGGCLITEIPFGARLKDFLSWPYRDPKETAVLKWGRYFRLCPEAFVMIGRDQRENDLLESQACGGDWIIRLSGERPGPLALLKSAVRPDEDLLRLAGGLVQRFSKFREVPCEVECFQAGHADILHTLLARPCSEAELESFQR